mmetsp:Transcript_3295/g.7186  ORF Transcript_3295/g.7186 Transcript_3295/m.7186 type:complete len:243 (+) Transcript_3295:94-822(+)
MYVSVSPLRSIGGDLCGVGCCGSIKQQPWGHCMQHGEGHTYPTCAPDMPTQHATHNPSDQNDLRCFTVSHTYKNATSLFRGISHVSQRAQCAPKECAAAARHRGSALLMAEEEWCLIDHSFPPEELLHRETSNRKHCKTAVEELVGAQFSLAESALLFGEAERVEAIVSSYSFVLRQPPPLIGPLFCDVLEQRRRTGGQDEKEWNRTVEKTAVEEGWCTSTRAVQPRVDQFSKRPTNCCEHG